MRAVPAVLAMLVIAACGNAEPPPETETPAADAGLTAADVAGTWQSEARLEGVPEPVLSTMGGSADGSDWVMNLEGRPGIPLTVRVAGDSLISESAEYESVLRPGVMVRVRTAAVLQNDELVGNMVAYYRTPQGEQQVPGTIRSRRIR